MSKVQKQRVQTFGRKKTATAVAVCQQGKIFFLLVRFILKDSFD
jgi:ribosomal protein S9